MEAEYYAYIKTLISLRGIGGTITRKDLVNYAIKIYSPRVENYNLNCAIRSSADRMLRRLRTHKFLKSSERGKNVILSAIPDDLNYFNFCKKYPL